MLPGYRNIVANRMRYNRTASELRWFSYRQRQAHLDRAFLFSNDET